MPSIQKKHNTKPSIFTQLIVPQFTMFEKEKMGKLNLNCKKKKKNYGDDFLLNLMIPQKRLSKMQLCLLHKPARSVYNNV